MLLYVSRAAALGGAPSDQGLLQGKSNVVRWRSCCSGPRGQQRQVSSRSANTIAARVHAAVAVTMSRNHFESQKHVGDAVQCYFFVHAAKSL